MHLIILQVVLNFVFRLVHDDCDVQDAKHCYANAASFIISLTKTISVTL